MERILFEIYCMCHVVVVNHMVRHMFDMMRLVSMRTCFCIRDTHEIQGNFRDLSWFKLYRSM